MKSVLFFTLIFIFLQVNLFADHKEKNIYKSPLSGSLIASTFVGGSATDGSYYTGDDIKIDSSGNVFVTGTTTSPDFPTQPGAYNQNNMGGSDVYIFKISPDLSTLLACTYIGGSNNDEARDLIIDQNGNVYITGITESSNFPTTTGYSDRCQVLRRIHHPENYRLVGMLYHRLKMYMENLKKKWFRI